MGLLDYFHWKRILICHIFWVQKEDNWILLPSSGLRVYYCFQTCCAPSCGTIVLPCPVDVRLGHVSCLDSKIRVQVKYATSEEKL